MTARKHHHVPQGYLRGFCKHRNKSKLFVVDVVNRTAFHTTTENVGAERDFHRVDVDGLAPDALETAFAVFDGELAEALQRIIAARSIANRDDFNYVLNLIGLQAVKTPGTREAFRQFIDDVMHNAVSLALATRERWEAEFAKAKAAGFMPPNAQPDYDKMKEFVERREYTLEVPTERHLAIELSTFDKILPIVAARKWLLLRAPQGATGFVTCDHPMCLVWSEKHLAEGPYPPGLAMTKTELVFPISNELAVIGTLEGPEGERDLSLEQVAHLNGLIIHRARRQIYARDGEFLYKFPHSKGLRRGVELVPELRAHSVLPPKK